MQFYRAASLLAHTAIETQRERERERERERQRERERERHAILQCS